MPFTSSAYSQLPSTSSACPQEFKTEVVLLKVQQNTLKLRISLAENAINNIISNLSVFPDEEEETPSNLWKCFYAPTFIPKSESAPTSPTISKPSTPSKSVTPVSGGFTFNVGVVNSPTAGSKTRKYRLNDGTFMIAEEITTPTGSPPRKFKNFSPEELKKRRNLVEEMKRNFLNSL